MGAAWAWHAMCEPAFTAPKCIASSEISSRGAIPWMQWHWEASVMSLPWKCVLHEPYSSSNWHLLIHTCFFQLFQAFLESIISYPAAQSLEPPENQLNASLERSSASSSILEGEIKVASWCDQENTVGEKLHSFTHAELLLHEQRLKYLGIFNQEHAQSLVSHMSEHFR